MVNGMTTEYIKDSWVKNADWHYREVALLPFQKSYFKRALQSHCSGAAILKISGFESAIQVEGLFQALVKLGRSKLPEPVSRPRNENDHLKC